MILTKEVEVKPNGKMIQYYKDLGYNAEYNKPLAVRVEDLQKSSHVKIEILCDMCRENIMIVKYDDYNRRVEESGSYVCKSCSCKKAKLTNLNRYGVENYGQTKECHEKMKKTLQGKYGVEHNSQLLDYKEKVRNTCIERYGESYAQHFTQKAFESFRIKTGYDNPSHSPVVKNKRMQTFINKFGYDNPSKSPEVRKKSVQTLYRNSSQKVSSQQRYISNLYNGILNYPVLYYNVDIYLQNDNLVIEYDGGGHNLNVITGRETQEEHDIKEIIRNNVIKREGYKQMRIISSRDYLPSDEILLQMLSEAKQYFTDYPNHSWIEYNIDSSTVRNAEHKDGIIYDFGELRKIKQSDIA